MPSTSTPTPKLTAKQREAVSEAKALVEDAKSVPSDVVATLLRALGVRVREG